MPADKEFPFGYGKEIYFWSFVVAILLFAGGAGLSIFKEINHLITPTDVRSSYVNYGVIGLAAIFEGAGWYIALREFSKSKGKWGYFQAVHRGKDPSIYIVLMEESSALTGLAVSFPGILSSRLPETPTLIAQLPSSSG